MGDVLSAADIFIWATSIAAGVLLCLAAYRGLAAKAQSTQARALLGEWFGYAYFHAKGGDVFYRERIQVSRNRWLPWRLSLTAEPSKGAGETIYRGRVICQSAFIYCSSFEPIFSDHCYQIGRRIMDGEHDGKTIIGLCIGNSYDERVHCANVHIWTRSQLDPDANRNRPANEDVERARFLEIANDYFEVSPDTFQLKMF